jgi:hypothetical protein
VSSRPPRRSLAGAFRPGPTGASRADGLSGLLPPRPSNLQPDSTVRSDEARAVRLAPEVDHPSPAAADAPPDVELDITDPDADRIRNVAVYLPVELLERLRRTARSREVTYAELLVEAASAHLDAVEPVLAPATVQPTGAGMPSRSRRAPRPGVQVQIRLDGHQLTWLDNQVARLKAPSRTALVAALLSRHLDAKGSSA